MAKKQYSLDYSIERDIDRLKAVQTILDNLEKKPTNTDLELMASYILYGKDENGKNAVQRGETTDSNKRYNSFQKNADKNQSLNEILENPLTNQQNLKPATERYIYTKKKPTIAKPKYDKAGNLLDPGDSDIPGMQELWSAIERIEHIVAVAEGKLPAQPGDQILEPYRLWQLKHQLIDMRRHQYYLKDSYKPTLHFLNASSSFSAPLYNWDSDAAYWMPLNKWQERVDNALLHTISRNIQDYETRINPMTSETEVRWVVRRHDFDWENPRHIKCLIDNYSNLYMQVWDKPDSWGRALIYDFDRYFNMCHFSAVREYVLTRRIDKATYPTIVNEIIEKFGIRYNENHLCTVITTEIPTRMAQAAKRHRLMIETPDEEKKRCWTCKKLFPRDILFFGRNSGRGDGLASNCKECERKRRIAKGGPAYDNRHKD